jgi:hypothetical protein
MTMTTPPENAVLDEDLGVTAEQVAAYLHRHADFLASHPELLQVLAPPSRDSGDGVIDMQTFMIQRLRGEIERLRKHQNALVASSRRNRSKQSQVHAAVVEMLAAKTFEHLIEVVTVDFVRILGVDVVTLCVEYGRDGAEPCRRAGVYCLEKDAIDAALGSGHDILLAADVEGDERIFGAGAGLVRSVALVRLNLGRGAPNCLLALGARQTGTFQPAQEGTEVFGFLARTLEHCLRVWLDLPA